MSLKVTSLHKRDGVYMLSPVGKLDTTTYEILEERVDAVMRHKPHTLIFDMQQLDYISSMGLRVIVRAQKLLQSNSGKVVLMNLQPQIRKVFAIIKAMPIQQIFTSMAELDEYLDNMQNQITSSNDASS